MVSIQGDEEMVFGCRLSKSINCAIGFIMLAGALIDDSFAKESLCNQFAIDHRARHIKVACESFEESLSPTPFPGAGKVLNCDDYRAETHDKCVAFQNAVEGYLALPDVVAERKLYLDGVKESLNNVIIHSNRTPISKNSALKFQDEAGFA